jgi:hypothetical protein
VDERQVVEQVRAVCDELPEASEESAWAGTRWRVKGRTFAHVVAVADGWPGAYARAAATDGPATLLTFRSSGPELDALRHGGPPFFAPVWRADEVGLVVGDDVDWDEVAELVTDSYCVQAPKRLAAGVLARFADGVPGDPVGDGRGGASGDGGDPRPP